jgi:hypothetical protein
MGEIHLRKDDGGDDLREENDVRREYQSGKIPGDTLCWKEGMVSWQPVSEVFPARGAAPAAAPPPLARATTKTKPAPARAPEVRHTYALGPWDLVLEIMIGLCLLMSAISLWGAFGQMAFAYVPLQSFDMTAAVAHDNLMYRLWWGSVAVWLVTLATYLVWLYRVNENCRALAPGFNSNTIFVLASYFIPVLSLAYPCMNMQEIWRASTNPAEWKHERSSTLVGLWWGFSLANGGMGWLLTHFPPVTDQATLWNISVAMIVFECIGLVLGVITFMMVFQVTAKQKYQLDEP